MNHRELTTIMQFIQGKMDEDQFRKEWKKQAGKNAPLRETNVSSTSR